MSVDKLHIGEIYLWSWLKDKDQKILGNIQLNYIFFPPKLLFDIAKMTFSTNFVTNFTRIY